MMFNLLSASLFDLHAKYLEHDTPRPNYMLIDSAKIENG